MKTSFRVCPHCDFSFPAVEKERATEAAVVSGVRPTRWYELSVSTRVVVLLSLIIIATTSYVVITMQRGDPCAGWEGMTRAFARNEALARGVDPEGAELETLIDEYQEHYETQRPEGC